MAKNVGVSPKETTRPTNATMDNNGQRQLVEVGSPHQKNDIFDDKLCLGHPPL